MCSKHGELGGGSASGAKSDEDGLGRAMCLDARLAAEIRRRGRGRSGGCREGAERLLDKLLQRTRVDTGAQNSDVARAENRVRVRLDVLCEDVAASRGE